jgi:hypothetical protein
MTFPWRKQRRSRPAQIVRVPSTDGSLVFYEASGNALILSSHGELFRASLGCEVRLEPSVVRIDWSLLESAANEGSVIVNGPAERGD